jgi:hypothetical protein
MARERSDEALTWSVFRHLEASGRLTPSLEACCPNALKDWCAA